MLKQYFLLLHFNLGVLAYFSTDISRKKNQKLKSFSRKFEGTITQICMSKLSSSIRSLANPLMVPVILLISFIHYEVGFCFNHCCYIKHSLILSPTFILLVVSSYIFFILFLILLLYFFISCIPKTSLYPQY